jgi:predicted secreted protein
MSRSCRDKSTMNKWTHIFFYLPFALLAAWATIGTTAVNNKDPKKVITITKENQGQEIKVKRDDLIRIELAEMGSAGYRWDIDRLNTEYLELISKETKMISESKIGGPVMSIWVLKAQKRGYIEIRMEHFRVWEGKEKASEHFSIRLTIK